MHRSVFVDLIVHMYVSMCTFHGIAPSVLPGFVFPVYVAIPCIILCIVGYHLINYASKCVCRADYCSYVSEYACVLSNRIAPSVGRWICFPSLRGYPLHNPMYFFNKGTKFQPLLSADSTQLIVENRNQNHKACTPQVKNKL
jgi:hypothetical protein